MLLFVFVFGVLLENQFVGHEILECSLQEALFKQLNFQLFLTSIKDPLYQHLDKFSTLNFKF